MKIQIGERIIEFPKGVEVKIIEDEDAHKFSIGQYVSYEGVVYRITALTDRGYAVKEVSIPKDEEWETTEIGFSQEEKMVELHDYEEIIDEWGDAHDATLRRKVNDAWNKNREGFAPILRALYARDIDEITDHDAFQYEEWVDSPECMRAMAIKDWEDYNEMALKHMQREWDFFAHNYLNHIADDADLECILNFLHYPYLPIFK